MQLFVLEVEFPPLKSPSDNLNHPIFRDDIRLPEVEKALQVEVDIVKSSGYDFVDAILKGWK